MNIFILNEDPVRSALDQCDKHIVKMPLESAQMLSTAHRILDGTETRRPSKSGKTMVKYWHWMLWKSPCTQWHILSTHALYGLCRPRTTMTGTMSISFHCAMSINIGTAENT